MSHLARAPGAVRVKIEAAPGTGPVAEFLPDIDHDGDGRIDGGEALDWMWGMLGEISLTLNGTEARPSLVRVDAADPMMPETGRGSVTIFAKAPRTDAVGAHRLGFRNAYAPAMSRWRASVFTGDGAWRYAVAHEARDPDGPSSAVDCTVPAL